MAFSRAKRFVYKKPEPTPSPADYVVSTTFERGCSISKSPRFQKPRKEEESEICKRAHLHDNGRCSTSSSEREEALNLLKRRMQEFNRNDTRQQSIRRRSLKYNEMPSTSNVDQRNSFINETFSLPSSSDFDDSFNNFERNDRLKDLEENEIKDRRKFLARKQTRKSLENEQVIKFKLNILAQLDKVVKRIEETKNDIVMLYYLHNRRIFLNRKHLTSLEKCEEMVKMIERAMENLELQIELKGKSMNIKIQENIQKLLADISTSSEKSIEEINTLCNNTTETLSGHMRNFFKNTTSSRLQSSVSETASAVEDLKENCLDNSDSLDYENLCSGTSHRIKQTQSVSDFEEDDDLDITIKLEETHEALELQGALIESFRSVLADLKEDLV